MSRNKTADLPAQDQAPVTAAEWFAGGQRIWYDPGSARVLTGKEAAATPGALRVFQRVAGAEQDAGPDAVWLTLLPGFPDGSYGWAQVDRMLGDGLGPRLCVEPVGQGDSDKPRDYRYSTVETPPSSARTWSRRCGGTTASAAPLSSRSTTRRWPCLSCSAASWSRPIPAAPPGRRSRPRSW
jgi:hypothetical protein